LLGLLTVCHGRGVWSIALVALLPLIAVAVLLFHIGRAPDVRLEVRNGELRVQQGWWDSIYCLKRRLDIPLDAIEGVAVAPKRKVPATGLRLPGTGVPGVIRAGSYGTGSSRDFWNVRRAQEYLVIQLAPGASYRRIVLEVPDPHAEALRLRPTVGAYTGDFNS
jgi:hypothetical protein